MSNSLVQCTPHLLALRLCCQCLWPLHLFSVHLHGSRWQWQTFCWHCYC